MRPLMRITAMTWGPLAGGMGAGGDVDVFFEPCPPRFARIPDPHLNLPAPRARTDVVGAAHEVAEALPVLEEHPQAEIRQLELPLGGFARQQEVLGLWGAARGQRRQ